MINSIEVRRTPMEVLKDKRIFIVEDDMTNMAVYAMVLRRSGAIVIQDHWNSGTMALLQRYMPVDVILLDLMLRFGISGYDIYDQLAEFPQLAKIPVIAVSASDPEIEIPKAKERGFAGFISKPISLRDFPGQIAAGIEGEKVWVVSH